MRLHLTGVILGGSNVSDHGVWVRKEKMSVGVWVWGLYAAGSAFLAEATYRRNPTCGELMQLPGKSFSQGVLL